MTAAAHSADYREFLAEKFKFSPAQGFDVRADEINQALAPLTRLVVPWVCKGGRRATFMAFGLHKTALALEVMRLIGTRGPSRRLIVLPLGVRHQFFQEAALRFTGRYAIRLVFIRSADELHDDAGADVIYVTNYETVRDGKLDPNLFNAAWLDEASVLRSFGSKTYQTFLTLFDQVQYRFVATATPSPNRYKELIHYAGFLGIMDTGQALTRFFQRDSTQANHLTLYPHMKAEFYAWLHSWALFIQRPSDVGLSDEGYTLPALDVRYHEVPASRMIGRPDRDGQSAMLASASMSLPDAADEKRDSIPVRVAKTVEILNALAPDTHAILWHTLEAERHAIQAAVSDAVSVWGSQDLDEREDRIIAFGNGEHRILSTKPEIAGSGCNFQQHCHHAVFVGIDYRFNDFIQAIYRLQRFGQTHPVTIDVIYTEAERQVLAELQRKWDEDTQLRAEMSALIKTYGLAAAGIQSDLARTIGCRRRVASGASYEIVNNDSVDEYARIASDRFGMILTSIPFGNHYEYSASYNDFGHNPDNDAFFRQMDYLTPHLLRTLKPGRILAVHVKDRIRFGNVTGDGFPTQDSFHEECVLHYKRNGFRKIGMITVVTDVVRENNQTYRLGWSEQCKDGTKMGVGSPEYILLFRKRPTDTSKGYADERVAKPKDEYTRARWQLDAHDFWRSSGNRFLTADELAQCGPDVIGKLYEQYSLTHVYDHEEHVAIGEALEARHALPATFMCLAPASHHPDVWHDVLRMRTLNGEQTRRGVENHICPLQFDVVDRLIRRYTNEGDEVSDPFGGLGTVAVRAMALGRRGHSVELKPEYFDDSLIYARAAEHEQAVPSLLDLVGAGVDATEGDA